MTARKKTRNIPILLDIPGPDHSGLPLSFSPVLFTNRLISQKSVQNPSKSDHFRECESFSFSATTTYNLNALKCTDPPASLTLNRNHNHTLNLNRGPHRSPIQPRCPHYFPFLPSFPSYPLMWQLNCDDCIKWEKMGQNAILTKLSRCAAGTYNDRSLRCPIFESGLRSTLSSPTSVVGERIGHRVCVTCN